MKRKSKSEKNLLSYYGFTKADQKKYPVVSGILRQLTPERIEKEIKKIQEVQLPPELQKWVDEYEKVGKRDNYIWKWAYKSFQYITYPCVSKKYCDNLLQIKCLYVIFFTLIDDTADKFKSKKLLEQMLKIPFNKDEIEFSKLELEKKRYLHFSIKLWDNIYKETMEFPKYKEYKNVLEFDLMQVLHIMNYAYLVNKNHYLINKTEFWEYFPYNMPFIFFLTIDLMNSKKFKVDELGIMREVAWQAQKLGQTINWLTTWEREIREGDITSGVFSHAIHLGILNIDELDRENCRFIFEKIKKGKIEKELLINGVQAYCNIKSLENNINTVSINKFLSGFKKFISLQLGSRGNY